MHKSFVTVPIKHEKPLIEQDVDSFPPGALDHELSPGLAENGRCIINKLTGIGFDTQVDAALRVRSRGSFHDSHASIVRVR